MIQRAAEILPQLQQHFAGGLDMPELARKAKKAAAQMQLFANPTEKAASEIRHADLNNLTPMQALELLRKLQKELE